MSEHLFIVAQVERQTKVEPDSVLNHGGWEAVTFVGKSRHWGPREANNHGPHQKLGSIGLTAPVAKLRRVDVLVSQGQSVVDAVRSIGVTDVTYYRWRSEFGGLKTDQIKRMKDLELENQRLRKAVSDLTLDKPILSEAAKGNF